MHRFSQASCLATVSARGSGHQRAGVSALCVAAGLLMALSGVAAAAAPPAEAVDTEWRERFVQGYLADYFRDRGLAQKKARAVLDAARASGNLRAELREAARYLLVAETDQESCDTVGRYVAMARSAGPGFERELFDLDVATAEVRSVERCAGRLTTPELTALAQRLGDPARMFFVLHTQHAALANAGRDNDRAALYAQQMTLAVADFQLAYCMMFLAQIDLVANPQDNQARVWLERARGLFSADSFPGLQARLEAALFRVESDAGRSEAAMQQMRVALPWVRRGVMGTRNSAIYLALFARALNKAGQTADALSMLEESRRFVTDNTDVRRTRSHAALEIFTSQGTPQAYASGMREIEVLQALMAHGENFKPRETRTYNLAMSAFYERFGRYDAALVALKQANKAGEEFQRRTSEATRVALQEKLNVAAKDKENARLKAEAELQSARQRGWIVAFGIAILGVAAAGAALAVAMRRGRRLARVSAELALRNDELEQRSASRIRLLAAASHDLRQPAHALGMLAELGSDVQHDPSRFNAWLQSVRRSASSLVEMLDQLMDLGRLDGGHYAPQLDDVSLAELLHDVTLHFGGLARAKGLTLEVPPAELHVRSDRHLLRRIVFNLVSNGIKYTDAGFVRLTVRQVGDTVELSVQDSGPGIPPDRLDDVFRDYVRLNPSKAAEGLGIGLSIVRRAAELLGHDLRLASPPGQGTTVALLLPRSSAPQVAEALPGAEGGHPQAEGVLALLEDDTDVRDAMAALLRRWGYTVHAAADAAELLKQLAALGVKPELLITDLHLGVRNGFVEAAQLRRALHNPTLPVLLVTGAMDASIAHEAARMQFEVAHKPLVPRRLAGLIRQLLPAVATRAQPSLQRG